MKGENPERDPYWFLFSLEMTQPQIYAKLVSMYIYDTFGIELRFKQIFSRGKDCMLTDEEYEIIKKCDSFLDILDERLMFSYSSSVREMLRPRLSTPFASLSYSIAFAS